MLSALLKVLFRVGNRGRSWFGRVPEVVVAAGHANQLPSVSLELLDESPAVRTANIHIYTHRASGSSKREGCPKVDLEYSYFIMKYEIYQ
jgi:hypothetical protein